mgnify:CR=1 FL=1
MSVDSKQLRALSRIYQEAVYGGAKKEAPKDTRLTVTAADKKANTKAYQNYKAGNKAYKAADHLKDEVEYATEAKKADKDYDGDGKCETPEAEYKGSKDKAIKKAIKKEGFSNWRHDLKEIPDYDQIPETTKDRNKKIEEKKVKNSVKINPTMEEETQVDEGVYEKQKTKEVMGALKKRDLKKDVKKKIAADIVKRKGDTSKSDDRYAYESKLWDEVAAHLTELGDLNDADFRVEGYQRNPEKGEEESRKAKRERKGGYDEKREKRMSSPTRGIDSPAFKEFMRSRGM